MSHSNGQAEIYVKIVKGILNKVKAEHKDPHLSILQYRNTPTDNLGSPAQLLMNRRLRLKHAVTLKHLKPKVISQKTVHEKLARKHSEKQNYFYNKSKRNLNELKPGDTIRVQNEKKMGTRCSRSESRHTTIVSRSITTRVIQEKSETSHENE